MNRFVATVLAIGVAGTLPMSGSSAAEGACAPALNFPYPANGSGPREFNVCLSNEGNVTSFEAPGGFVHLGPAEGYLLCTAEDAYWDLGSLGGSGFAAATVSQPKGPGSVPVTITRLTADGAWELKQTFTKDNNEQDVSITTTLKRLATQLDGPVYLGRYADGNVDGTSTGDFGDRSLDSLFFRDGRALTLMAQSLGLPRFTAIGAPGFVFSGGGQTPSCVPTSAAVPVGPGDQAGVVSYDLGGFKAAQQRVVRFVYQRK